MAWAAISRPHAILGGEIFSQKYFSSQNIGFPIPDKQEKPSASYPCTDKANDNTPPPPQCR
ncbi:hypothetical protein CEXT_326761, partial [Caerostris extrusa]